MLARPPQASRVANNSVRQHKLNTKHIIIARRLCKRYQKGIILIPIDESAPECILSRHETIHT